MNIRLGRLKGTIPSFESDFIFQGVSVEVMEKVAQGIRHQGYQSDWSDGCRMI